MAKNVQIGTLMVSEGQYGKQVSIGLGKKNKGEYSKYDLTVELIVKDATGKVVAKQTDGFINLIDPRTKPDSLLKAGAITEEQYAKQKAAADRIPDKIKYELQVKLG